MVKSTELHTYEKWVDGRVVERVVVQDGSYEDTRLGMEHLEGGQWRLEGAGPPPVPVSEPEAEQSSADSDESAEPTGEQDKPATKRQRSTSNREE